jgi:Rps23 Pro-64 3,4-dihydroxylase Tpa1-like proline 4-hydroxylase
MLLAKSLNSDNIQELSRAFSSFSDSNVQDPQGKLIASVCGHPFRSVVLPQLISLEDVLELRKAIDLTELLLKSNDLYEFQQSNDLKHSHLPIIQQFIQSLFSSDWIQTMTQITGIELNSTIDVAAQKYSQGGYLLCHDDDMGEDFNSRKIAFITYLVDETWSEKDGGHLDLFSTNEQGQPHKIVRSILPKAGQFAFFEVTSTSYHQVREILAQDKDRYSITGWFHGSRDVALQPWICPVTSENVSPIPLKQLINPTYITSISKLNEAFSEQSYLILKDFLRPDVYKTLTECLVEQKWTPIGPANVKKYETLAHATPFLQSVIQSLSSKEFKEFLESVTGLSLERKKDLETLKFREGDYTLMHDHNLDEPGLDFRFSFSEIPQDVEEWDDSWGGLLHYIMDKETLLSRTPATNELLLVYRDAGVLKFIKYLNHKCRGERRDITGLFVERQ